MVVVVVVVVTMLWSFFCAIAWCKNIIVDDLSAAQAQRLSTTCFCSQIQFLVKTFFRFLIKWKCVNSQDSDFLLVVVVIFFPLYLLFIVLLFFAVVSALVCLSLSLCLFISTNENKLNHGIFYLHLLCFLDSLKWNCERKNGKHHTEKNCIFDCDEKCSMTSKRLREMENWN